MRFRTIGDATCTAAVESSAFTVEDIVAETAVARVTERGATRADDRISEAGMEDRKTLGVLLRSTAGTARRDGPPRRTGAPLRFATVGSVDDGKSTLIGRLLHDSKSIFEDQLEHIEAVSKRRGNDYVDLALLTDGLRAEREQGITIDVAYRYFSTPHRDFVIADCPGHVQYTRNMITGASTADLAIVLVDARHGVVEQTRRHSLLVSLLGVPHLVICVNKMDLVDYDRGPLRARSARSSPSSPAASTSATSRSSRSRRSTATTSSTARRRCRGTSGPTLLHHLETVYIGERRQPDRRPLPRAVRRSAPSAPSTATTAATPAPSPPGRCAPATR